MDYIVISAERHIRGQQDANEQMCYEEADRNGKLEQADLCDDGDVGCKNCPFKTKAQ